MTCTLDRKDIKGFCLEKGSPCFWANANGYCNLTMCIRFYEFALKEMGIAPKGA